MSGQVIQLDIGTSDEDSVVVNAWRVLGEGAFDWDIVGEASYQDALLDIAAGHLSEDGVEGLHLIAILVAEQDNPVDPNAVAVYIEGRKVGHLGRHDAPDFHGDLLEVSEEFELPCAAVVCDAMLKGGFRKPDGSRASIGVFLDMELPFI